MWNYLTVLIGIPLTMLSISYCAVLFQNFFRGAEKMAQLLGLEFVSQLTTMYNAKFRKSHILPFLLAHLHVCIHIQRPIHT